MPKSAKPESGEWIQVATLTFAMTGGGFALVLLLLNFFMIPEARSNADRSQNSYADLTKELLKRETKDLRANAKRAEGQDLSTTLGEIIKQAGDANGIRFPNFPAPSIKKTDKGPEEHRIKITSESSKLQFLAEFVAAVEQKKKTIQVEAVNFKRDPRAKAEEDLWTCTAEFVDYVARSQ